MQTQGAKQRAEAISFSLSTHIVNCGNRISHIISAILYNSPKTRHAPAISHGIAGAFIMPIKCRGNKETLKINELAHLELPKFRSYDQLKTDLKLKRWSS